METECIHNTSRVELILIYTVLECMALNALSLKSRLLRLIKQAIKNLIAK